MLAFRQTNRASWLKLGHVHLSSIPTLVVKFLPTSVIPLFDFICNRTLNFCQKMFKFWQYSGRRAGYRARGRSGGRRCTAGQYGYVPLGRHLVLFYFTRADGLILAAQSFYIQRRKAGRITSRSVKPGPHQQQCRSNVRLCCQKNGNNVERVLRWNFVLSTKSNVASILLLVWTGLNDFR